MKAVLKVVAAVAAIAAGVLVVAVTVGSQAGAADQLARAVLRNAEGTVVGELVFEGSGGVASRVQVELDLPAIELGLDAYHGIHVHTAGVCDPPFTSAGGHWNPDGASHGHHTGDLPSVLVSGKGKAYTEFETHRFRVSRLFDDDGSAVVLHAGPDNFANIPTAYGGPNAATLATGDAGGRYACGVVTPG